MKPIITIAVIGPLLLSGCLKHNVDRERATSSTPIENILPANASEPERLFIKNVTDAFATTNVTLLASMVCWTGIAADETIRTMYQRGDRSIMEAWNRKLELKRVDPALESTQASTDGSRARPNLPVRWKLIAYLGNGATSEYLVGETNGVLMLTVSTAID